MDMGDVNVPQRGDVYLISLDPTKGREIKKTRPCLVVSPNELNDHLSTFLVAPMTTGGHRYPFRIPCQFQKTKGFIVLDQIRTIDRARLIRRLGRVSAKSLAEALSVLQEMFTE
jgi:mRNA interferase MazF